MQKPKHIILLGASVGKAWNIEFLPDRLNRLNSSNPINPSNPTNPTNPSNPSNPSNPGDGESQVARAQGVDEIDLINRSNAINPSNPINQYRFQYVGKYEFDKTDALRDILERKENKPDAIIIKECAAYFPGDFPNYQALIKNWVIQCRRAGVAPILATVVPVIRDRSLKMKVKDLIKKLIGRPTSESRFESRLAAIIEYNDWIKSFAQKEGLTVLDLETPLHVSDEDRSLRPDLHSGDGLHLNAKAYALLDRIVIPTIEPIFSK